jgi:hypothetical protein
VTYVPVPRALACGAFPPFSFFPPI